MREHDDADQYDQRQHDKRTDHYASEVDGCSSFATAMRQPHDPQKGYG